MNQFIWSRWVRSTTINKPSFETQAIQDITACRMVVEVEFDELSPQIQPIIIGAINVRIKRAETGELLVAADYTV